MNQQHDIAEILGTTAFQGYVDTPLKTLDGLCINQPWCFLPLTEEAKCLAEEIRKEQEVQQWAGIPHKQLLNQSFTDQLNCIQTLETLAPLKLVKQYLPKDIINFLERLGKADNIPCNQLYSIVKNCADRYYTNVIKAFTTIINRQFANCQILLVNTARALKFLREYANRQVQLWQILQIYHDVPDQVWKRLLLLTPCDIMKKLLL